MASVDRDTINSVVATTGLLAVPRGQRNFVGPIVFTADAHPVFASQFPIGLQNIDAGYGRALNAGRGLVGEGGATGTGVVGLAGGVIAQPDPALARNFLGGPFPGQGVRVGVLGIGMALPARDAQVTAPGNCIGVWGLSDTTVGVFGSATAHAGVYGISGVTGVFGDGRNGQLGVEGVGSRWGVYGHVDFASPNADGAGVCGAAALNLDGTAIGAAGLFLGPVDVVGNLRVTGDSVVWGTKSATARHDDGSHRLLYCVESPESQFEDFGEVRLIKGKATVKLDRDFAAVADTRQYHVFITPYGASRGLYVARRTRAGFDVVEQDGGKSSLEFSYRVVAKRKDVKTKRFQRVRPPSVPELPAELATPATELPLKPSKGRKRRKARKRPHAGARRKKAKRK